VGHKQVHLACPDILSVEISSQFSMYQHTPLQVMEIHIYFLQTAGFDHHNEQLHVAEHPLSRISISQSKKGKKIREKKHIPFVQYLKEL
jgi:hypothetical protein